MAPLRGFIPAVAHFPHHRTVLRIPAGKIPDAHPPPSDYGGRRRRLRRFSGFLSASFPCRVLPYSAGMEPADADLIAAVLKGDIASFEPLVKKYSPRLFATARRYARRES